MVTSVPGTAATTKSAVIKAAVMAKLRSIRRPVPAQRPDPSLRNPMMR